MNKHEISFLTQRCSQFKEIICHNSYACQPVLALTEYSLPPAIIAPLIIHTSRQCRECVGETQTHAWPQQIREAHWVVCVEFHTRSRPGEYAIPYYSPYLVALPMEHTNPVLFIW